MKKKTVKKWILSLAACALTAVGFAMAAPFIVPAKAEQMQNAPTDELITPSSYEQYLPLIAPTDAAFYEDFTAIADENRIYLYDRLHGVYRKYEHSINSEPYANQISEVEFSDEGDLYFLDASSYLYILPLESLSLAEFPAPTETRFACSTFTIEGETLYYTNVTGTTTLFKTSLNALDATKAQSIYSGIHSKPAIAFYEHKLYYTDYGIHLKRVDPTAGATPESVCVFQGEIRSLSINADELYCTDVDGTFYAYNFSSLQFEREAKDELASTIDNSGDNVSVSAYGSFVYLVQGGSVREYECGEGFTGYEISASSDSENRLSGAVDAVLTGDLLLTADAGNRRISVYTRSTKTYRTIKSVEGLLRLASDGQTVAAITSTQALLYDLTSGELLKTFETFNGKPVGVAAVYGVYYVVSDTNYYYKLFQEETENGAEWTIESSLKQNSRSPRQLASDVYGNLYVSAVNKVTKFTESGFMDELDFGEDVCTIPTESTKLLVDYEERVYALYENTLYAYQGGEQTAAYPLGKTLVYSQTTDTPVSTVAFGVEDNAAYLTYDGCLTVCTQDLQLPTMRTIATESVNENIFGDAAAQFKVVEASKDALLVAFDLAGTKDAEYFSYTHHARSKTAVTALQIGETERYGVLAVFDKEKGEYDNYLLLKRYLTALDPSVYQKTFSEEEQKTVWLTNAIHLYKFPYLTELLTNGNAEKNQALTVLGEVTELDYDYYLVSYETESGERKTGYVPIAYTTNFNGAPPTSEDTVYGEREAALDSVYRMTYLLLGTAAIALLVDYLILRKKEN
ncbi:MAG: hypothetical protein IJX81_05645 [Clostridia bacterium]|nr:hypothetical protein [Clostridia bacterium]